MTEATTLASNAGSLPKPSPESLKNLAELTSAEKLEQAVEAAGYVHPDAPAGFATPGHKLAAEQTPEEIDRLKEIAALAQQAKTASPAGVETIADQIIAHVEALGGK